jgi:hypothetical protein
MDIEGTKNRAYRGATLCETRTGRRSHIRNPERPNLTACGRMAADAQLGLFPEAPTCGTCRAMIERAALRAAEAWAA